MTYAFMRRLESTPSRYDRGIELLSGGRIGSVYDRIAEMAARPGANVLDVGCGTGGVSIACEVLGAHVTGIDRDAGMLEIAAAKSNAVQWLEIDATEIEDHFGPESLDAVVSCLAFSEMSPQVQRYVLSTASSRLRPGGRLVIADEVEPDRVGQRVWYRVRRAPVMAVTWLLTQTGTRPVKDLARSITTAGFTRIETERPWPSFLIVSAVKPS
jgi:ubiquinone/menaquinone biosynthesis C-methylase UbiE